MAKGLTVEVAHLRGFWWAETTFRATVVCSVLCLQVNVWHVICLLSSLKIMLLKITIIIFKQIEDVADGAVKPPPNKIPIFFFGTHET